ncbi:MAG: T9SS type A sorting domain-containing protein [Ignavibacteria bacterium]|nr:T9SS type A sorting domain-containing protein [Ignavibacteria bacterium]
MKSFKSHSKFIGLKIILFILITGNCYGQSITWQRILNNNYGSLYQAQQTNDGGYIAVGSVRMNNTDKMYLTKLDNEGITEWIKIIGDINTEGTWVIETNDNGFAVCGRTDSAGWNKCYLVKTDSLGNILWQKMYNVSDMDRANCVKQTSDGGFIIAGITFPLEIGVLFLKIDSLGNLILQKTYYSNQETKIIREIAFTQNNIYAVGGYSANNQTDVYLMKLDFNLDTIWTKRIGGNNTDIGYSLDIDNANQIIVTGDSRSYNVNNKYETFVSKIDSNGSVIWQRTYSGLGRESCKTIRVINDSLYVVSGSSDSLNNNTNKAKIRLIDYSGNVLFENSYLPGTIGAGFESTELTSDNGFISSGYVIQNGAVENMYIVKSDSLLKAQPIGLLNISENIPQNFKVYQNYPNPFNPVTSINFDISTKTDVKLIIYNSLGQTVENIDFGSQNAGSYNYKWHSSNIPSGIYFCKIIAGDSFNVIKMILLK